MHEFAEAAATNSAAVPGEKTMPILALISDRESPYIWRPSRGIAFRFDANRVPPLAKYERTHEMHMRKVIEVSERSGNWLWKYFRLVEMTITIRRNGNRLLWRQLWISCAGARSSFRNGINWDESTTMFRLAFASFAILTCFLAKMLMGEKELPKRSFAVTFAAKWKSMGIKISETVMKLWYDSWTFVAYITVRHKDWMIYNWKKLKRQIQR